MASNAGVPLPKKEAVESIHHTVHMIDKKARANFDKAFDIWKKTWNLEGTAWSHNHHAAYNALERNTKYKVGPDDIANFKDLQKQSAMIIDINHERKLKFNSLVATWAEQQREHIGDNNSSAYTVDCDAYWELMDLGPSIIAYVMLEYAADQDGWWHELLHELVHGERGGSTFFKAHLYGRWRDWFENGDYDQAPRGELWPEGKWPGPSPRH